MITPHPPPHSTPPIPVPIPAITPSPIFIPLSHGMAIFLMVLTTFLWSIAGVVTRQLQGAVLFEVSFWRAVFTVLSLAMILPFWRRYVLNIPSSVHQPWWRRWWGLDERNHFIWLSALGWSVMFTAFMLAMTLTLVANVLVIMACIPLVTAILSGWWFREHPSRWTWFAIGLAVLGIAWIYWPHPTPTPANPLAENNPLASPQRILMGSLVALLVPLAAGFQWTVVESAKRHAQRHNLPMVDMTPAIGLGALLSALMTLIPAFPFSATLTDLAWLALLGCFQLAIPCMLALLSSRTLHPIEIGLLAQLEILFGILLAWWGADEQPTRAMWQGGLVVLVALIINTQTRSKAS